ncbi:uncharacterized protein LOC103717428 [Phoenix dactylifera]|uniref:Uncharacterized protein LOC103717428 n=1 Tax=Phoenix dactylifera TaxID=42345 RepID=A0A8B7CQH6_PHODC|nr:uncharacterized protein LOC103717428 [Phoenix dactylifera]
MSGGVGPTAGGDDIRLPKEEEEKKKVEYHQPAATAQSPRRRFFSLRQLNALAVVIVLSASGMVSAADIAFALFSLVYLHLLSSAAFPRSSSSSAAPDPPIFGFRNPLLAIYVSVGALLGLLLPIAYILDGVLAGDKEGIKAAAPHVFLLAAQVFLENVTFSGRFSLPIRAFVPIFYNTKRLFTLADWVRHEIGKVEDDHGSPRRLFAGRALAVANMGFWAFNLFGFLLPVYLPRVFKRYHCGSYDNNNNNNNKKESLKAK